MPDLDRDAGQRVIEQAMLEDLGPLGVDLTGRYFTREDAVAVADFRSRASGVLAGLALLPMVVEAFEDRLGDPARPVSLKLLSEDGQAVSPGQVVATVEGSLRTILALERTALNLLTHLSGVASLSARFVAAVRHAGAATAVCDTRKTLPGLRALQKYAVACGGGVNHRMGLYDAALVKDNHLSAIPLAKLTATLTADIAAVRTAEPGLRFVMVEVDSLDQLERVLPAAPDLVLLDNMDAATLRLAVAMRTRLAPNVKLEASGGVTLASVGSIAATGVDRVSIGALTHSAPSLDLGLDAR